MENNLTVIVPNEAELFAIAREAIDKGLHLVTNGKHARLVRTIPAGWEKIRVTAKPQLQAAA